MDVRSKKLLALVGGAGALAITGGMAALGAQLYRHPRETINAVLHGGLLLAGVREGTVDVGIPMHYYTAGRSGGGGSPLVLIHGLGSSAESWSGLMLLLSKEFLVYAPDFPGFGKTPMAPEGVTIRTHVDYLRRFLDALGYLRVTLAGNSLGGWIAARFAAEYPERVDRLYLLNSAGLLRESTNPPYAVNREQAKRVMQHIMGYRFPVPGFILDSFIRNTQLPAYKQFLENYDPREELDNVLEQIKAPTMIVWGERDGIFPLTCAFDLHKGIPDSRLVLLPRAGHVTQVQAPLTVARIILRGNKRCDAH
ncbi:MAG TPA: alpha/beta hydrolase [Ktedonobacteraceae bacterium]|nr:alpha/beta hydrolase [Ktedonobacteraceae bacterium]